MTFVAVNPQFDYMLQPPFLCRNGQVVGVHTENAMRAHMNQILGLRGKELFAFAGPLTSITASSLSSRVRWRFRGQTSPTCLRLHVHVLMAQATDGTTSAYSYFTDPNFGTIKFSYGTYNGTAPSDVPSEFAELHGVLNVDADTRIDGEFGDAPGARLIAAIVYEEMVAPDTSYGFLLPTSAGGNILDIDRQRIAENLGAIWYSQGSQSWNWTTDVAGSAFTNTTNGVKNILNSSVTTVSAASPGATIDLTGKATARQEATGVPVSFDVYAGSTAQTGTVRLVNSAGTTMLSVTIPVGAAAWQTVSGVLPASADKYDVHGFVNNIVSGTLTVHAFSLYELGTGNTTTGTWTVDVTSSKALPQNASEWTALMSSAGLATGNPSNLWTMQEASGSILDKISTANITGTGGPTYSNAVTGWTAKALQFSDAGGAFMDTTAVGGLTQSQALLAYVQIRSTPGALRTIMGVGSLPTPFTFANLTSSPVYAAYDTGGGSPVNGTSNPGTSVRPVLIVVNVTANTFTIYTDQDKIVGPWTSKGGTNRVIFGAGSSTTPDVGFLYGALFSGTAAELTSTQAKTLLVKLGWTIPWS